MGKGAGKGKGKKKGKKDKVQVIPGGLTAEEEKESSNYREFRNLVEASEEEAAKGGLNNCEYFLFTDNSTTELAYHKGSSSSRQLHELVLQLKMLEMKFKIKNVKFLMLKKL